MAYPCPSLPDLDSLFLTRAQNQFLSLQHIHSPSATCLTSAHSHHRGRLSLDSFWALFWNLYVVSSWRASLSKWRDPEQSSGCYHIYSLTTGTYTEKHCLIFSLVKISSKAKITVYGSQFPCSSFTKWIKTNTRVVFIFTTLVLNVSQNHFHISARNGQKHWHHNSPRQRFDRLPVYCMTWVCLWLWCWLRIDCMQGCACPGLALYHLISTLPLFRST